MATYRDTNQIVGCHRLIVDNPRGSSSRLQFDRYRIIDNEQLPISTAAVLAYESDSSKESFNADNTFIRKDGSTMTYREVYEVMSDLFEHVTVLQDNKDIARDNYYAAAKAIGANV